MCVRLLSQKADGNASGFYKYTRADGIQIKSNPHKSNTSILNETRNKLSNPSVIRKPSSTNSSKNSPSIRNSNQSPQQPNPKSADLNHGRLCSSDNKCYCWWCGNLRPEGNIQPNSFGFLQLIKLLKLLNSETWHRMHTSEFLNFRCQTSFYRIPPI